VHFCIIIFFFIATSTYIEYMLASFVWFRAQSLILGASETGSLRARRAFV